MADLPEKDAALLLDMLLAARDARGFVADLTEAAFRASRLHQNAVIRSLEVIGEAAGKVSLPDPFGQPGYPLAGGHRDAAPVDPWLRGYQARSDLDGGTGSAGSTD